MIENPTCLILGAGASNPYGYPCGEKLIIDIVTLIDSKDFRSVIDLLHKEDIYQQEVDQFKEYLNGGAYETIDDFIESNPNFSQLAKIVIAWCILKNQDHKLLEREDSEGWYKHLINALRKDCKYDEFENKNNLSIITFNYDRSLEQFLYTTLKYSYREQKHPENLVETIPIIHVHGRLGALPWEKNGSYYVDYRPQTDLGVFINASKLISLVPEGSDDSLSFIEARRLMFNSKRILFLGFGYHDTNLRRIGLSQWIKDHGNGYAFGTAYKLPKARLKVLQDKFEYPKLQFSEKRINDFLKDNILL